MTPDTAAIARGLTEAGQCGILFSQRSVVEPSGECILPDRHEGPHDTGTHCWHTDMECDCEDCMSDEPDNWCVVYWEKNQ